MKIHREGLKILIGWFVFLLAGYIGSWQLHEIPLLGFLLMFVFMALYVMVLQFFRIPNRSGTFGVDAVISPCDGKVVVIEEVEETEYFNDKRIQISIFMSPLNVHANYAPIGGEVAYNQYHPGKFLVAFNPKSSELNERQSMVIKNDEYAVLVKQIAGAVARRIRNYVEPSQKLQQNEEFGFIRFGSRLDVFLPLDSKITVSLNQKVKGRQTKLATL